ncbi:hypothetical protein Sps_04765 [Shewanella psychrophila]|uniref:Uncharacterized protein n=1 Tax=Shewanella psychrophila TaxID=225848 RepID=A0A1S6HWR0_9GAMM|nr:hypothetical protein [Shewanella psychrophila]AQS39848.1 hypothetical protein Sps_04765 [Shewanella psychrophila]
MKRINEGQTRLENEYDTYNKAAITDLPELEIGSQDSLASLLDTVTKRESLDQGRKLEPSATKLKSAIADVLLLLDGFDLQKVKSEGMKAKE